MPTSNLDDLAVRVALLERRAQGWRRTAVILAALVAATGVMAFRPAASPAVDAERLVLHSSRGGRAIELSVGPQGALEAQFMGDTSALRAMMRSNEFVLRDATGREIAHIGGPVVQKLAP